MMTLSRSHYFHSEGQFFLSSESIRKTFSRWDIPFVVAPDVDLTITVDFNLLLAFLSVLVLEGDVMQLLPVLFLSCDDDILLVLL